MEKNIRSLGTLLTGMSWDEFKPMLLASLVRGWDVGKNIWWPVAALFFFLRLINGLLSEPISIDKRLIASIKPYALTVDTTLVVPAFLMALAILAARPCIGLRSWRYFFLSRQSLITAIWLLLVIVYSYLLNYLPALWLFVANLALLRPYGLWGWSPWMIVPALWALDASGGLALFFKARLSAWRVMVRSLPFFIIVAVSTTLILWILNALCNLVPLPLAYTAFIVPALVVPWYVTLLSNWYILVRYR